MTNKTVFSKEEVQRIKKQWQDDDGAASVADLIQMAGQAALQSTEIQQRLWQPIETAPKDGTRYIGAYRYEEVWFAEVVGDHSVSTSAGKLFPATHWMPLPKPPIDAAMEVKP